MAIWSADMRGREVELVALVVLFLPQEETVFIFFL